MESGRKSRKLGKLMDLQVLMLSSRSIKANLWETMQYRMRENFTSI